MNKYLEDFKKKRKIVHSNIKYNRIISNILLGIIFFLLSLIWTNMSDKNLLLYKEYVFTESLPFTKIKNWYETKFGDILPEQNNIQAVFNEKLIYKDINEYKDGEVLTIADKSIISALSSGVVVFQGNKDDYGYTLIIQGIDGYDIWYGNIENCNYKLYDYIEKGSVIGNTINDKLYLVIKKDNDIIKYEDYKD